MSSVLTPDLLLRAYTQGYFPESILREVFWLRPPRRAILSIDTFEISRSLKRKIRGEEFTWTYDHDFLGVMKGCADRPETWISDEFFEAYSAMHKLGLAHSVEVWRAGALVGGLYGVTLGGAFFAESKFRRVSHASKIAVHALVERLKSSGFALLEVQFLTPHLSRMGAREVSDEIYQQMLKSALAIQTKF